MRHVVFLSGGLGSWATLRRVIERHGRENTYALFTDTLIEDKTLYKFLIDTLTMEFEVQAPESAKLVSELVDTSYETQDERKRQLTDLAEFAEREIPRFYWRNAGRDVWDIFFEEEMLGNSRLARCSHVIKQDLARSIVDEYFDASDTVLYLGIDWTEEHRTEAPKHNWSPYPVEFPMCDEPYATNIDHIKELERLGVDIPRLYAKGFAHNNCGGFCVRAGQGHFVNLLTTLPGLYEYHERKEREWQAITGKDYTILRKQRQGVRYRYSLKELREDFENERHQHEIDFNDVGGCGCFIVE